MNEVETRFKEKKTISKMFTIPEIFWDEWQEDCKSNFNNTYHLKMQFDHEFRKQFQHVSNLLIGDIVKLQEEVFELKAKLGEISSQVEEISIEDKKSSDIESSEPKRLKTFGG